MSAEGPIWMSEERLQEIETYTSVTASLGEKIIRELAGELRRLRAWVKERHGKSVGMGEEKDGDLLA